MEGNGENRPTQAKRPHPVMPLDRLAVGVIRGIMVGTILAVVAVVIRVGTGSIRVVIVLVRVVIPVSSDLDNVPAAHGTGSAGVGELVLQVHHCAMVVFGPLETGARGAQEWTGIWGGWGIDGPARGKEGWPQRQPT